MKKKDSFILHLMSALQEMYVASCDYLQKCAPLSYSIYK